MTTHEQIAEGTNINGQLFCFEHDFDYLLELIMKAGRWTKTANHWLLKTSVSDLVRTLNEIEGHKAEEVEINLESCVVHQGLITINHEYVQSVIDQHK
jgi:hypothetical protein